MNRSARKKVLIRADASLAVGAGHLMRMYALAQLLQESGHEVHLATIFDGSGILHDLEDEFVEIHTLDADGSLEDQQKQFLTIAEFLCPDWVVLDGYSFPTEFEREIRNKGFRLIRVSDFTDSHSVADVLLDQNFGADTRQYSVEPYTVLLTGLKHILIRREFRQLSPKKRSDFDTVNTRLIISLGGGSPKTDLLNLKIVKALASISLPHWSATLIVGKMGTRSSELMDAVQSIPWPVRVLDHVTSMANEMLNADIGILAGGSVMWEALYMRVPFLAFSLTEKQDKYLHFLEDHKLCRYLGEGEKLEKLSLARQIVEFVENRIYLQHILQRADELFDRGSPGSALLKILEIENHELSY